MDSPAPQPAWPPPPPEFHLADDEIHVWCAALDGPAADPARFFSLLCPSERERAQRFRFERHRRWFIVRRGLLRLLVGRYLNIGPDQLVFTCGARGKPSVSECQHTQPLHFNLSDSSGLALYAMTRAAPLGVDTERLEPVRDLDGLAARFYSPREKAALDALPEPQKTEAFFNCWTRKEAYLKATGEGISESLPKVEFTLAPGDPPRMLSIAGDARTAAKWMIYSFEPAPGFVGALAIKAKGLKLSCWRCPEN
jgi:4'-phosphopantetheinyl transferase